MGEKRKKSSIQGYKFDINSIKMATYYTFRLIEIKNNSNYQKLESLKQI